MMRQPIRILHLEDNRNDAELVQASIESSEVQWEITLAEDKDTYAAALQKGQFDLIVSDYQLPSFDGLSALKMARAAHPDIPFIFVSGAIGETLAIETLKAGAEDYVLKNDLPRLFPTLKRVLKENEKKAQYRETQKVLREAQENLSVIFRSIPMAIYRAVPTGNFKVLWMSDNIHFVTGFRAQSFQEDDNFWASRIHPDEREEVLRKFEQILEKGVVVVEYRWLCAEDKYRWFLDQAVLINGEHGDELVGSWLDITSHKEADLAKRALTEQNDLILRSAGEGIYGLDRNGLTTFVNRAAAEMLGWTEEELLGKPLHYLIHHTKPDGTPYPREECPIYSAFHDGFTHHRDDEIFWRKDGSFFPVEYASTPILNENKIVGAVVTFKDISTRKEMERQLHRRNNELQKALFDIHRMQQQVIQQERLRALGEMASGIAHDFNNTLTPILGYSEICLLHPELLNDKDKVIEYLRLISISAQDAAKVVSRLREFYRPRSQQETFAPTDINKIIPQAVSLTQPKWKDQALENGVTISVQTELNKVPFIKANESELREVLTNLIFNAADAIPKDGVITVSTYFEADQVVLKVSDTGIGMTEEVRSRCLEPFFTTKGDKGSGLGLSIIYGIIQRHKAAIDIQTEPGKGTNFFIRFPTAEAEKKEETPQADQKTVRSLHILYAEDEISVRNVIVKYLTFEGHTVEVASNGREGLEKFYAGSFDLVITDRAMPEMNGDEMAAAIFKTAPNKPVILLSGTGSLMSAAGELPPGVSIVIGKPVTLDDLRQAINKVMPC